MSPFINPAIPAQARFVGEPPSGGSVHVVTASDGVKLRVAIWPGTSAGAWSAREPDPWAGEPKDRGTILLLHGRTEFIEKYYPVIVELLDRGFAVATMDWRGQGLSERPLGHPLKGHVDDFNDYQLDLDALLSMPEVQALPGPMTLLSHSMGGAVAIRRLKNEPDRFAGAMFSSPMLGLLLTPGVDRAANVAAQVVSDVGLHYSYAPGQPMEPYSETIFMGNVMTSDFDEYTRQRELIKLEPGLAIAGVTWGWLRAALKEMAALETVDISRIKALYWVGSEEAVVSSPMIAARAAASRSRLRVIAGAKHEALFERPELRSRVWREIDSFLVRLELLPKKA